MSKSKEQSEDVTDKLTNIVRNKSTPFGDNDSGTFDTKHIGSIRNLMYQC